MNEILNKIISEYEEHGVPVELEENEKELIEYGYVQALLQRGYEDMKKETIKLHRTDTNIANIGETKYWQNLYEKEHKIVENMREYVKEQIMIDMATKEQYTRVTNSAYIMPQDSEVPE